MIEVHLEQEYPPISLSFSYFHTFLKKLLHTYLCQSSHVTTHTHTHIQHSLAALSANEENQERFVHLILYFVLNQTKHGSWMFSMRRVVNKGFLTVIKA